MKIRLSIVGMGLLLVSGGAFAFHCPQDMKKIDQALKAKPAIGAAQLAEIKQLRAEGESLHQQGRHQESVDTLAKAMKILNIQ